VVSAVVALLMKYVGFELICQGRSACHWWVWVGLQLWRSSVDSSSVDDLGMNSKFTHVVKSGSLFIVVHALIQRYWSLKVTRHHYLLECVSIGFRDVMGLCLFEWSTPRTHDSDISDFQTSECVRNSLISPFQLKLLELWNIQ
jgi:hypothetical protein